MIVWENLTLLNTLRNRMLLPKQNDKIKIQIEGDAGIIIEVARKREN
jgi:hypothetical protein